MLLILRLDVHARDYLGSMSIRSIVSAVGISVHNDHNRVPLPSGHRWRLDEALA